LPRTLDFPLVSIGGLLSLTEPLRHACAWNTFVLVQVLEHCISGSRQTLKQSDTKEQTLLIAKCMLDVRMWMRGGGNLYQQELLGSQPWDHILASLTLAGAGEYPFGVG
jgi:hypothetical protein